jgi:hypothetical protein
MELQSRPDQYYPPLQGVASGTNPTPLPSVDFDWQRPPSAVAKGQDTFNMAFQTAWEHDTVEGGDMELSEEEQPVEPSTSRGGGAVGASAGFTPGQVSCGSLVEEEAPNSNKLFPL